MASILSRQLVLSLFVQSERQTDKGRASKLAELLEIKDKIVLRTKGPEA
jgi:hypothetical protein